MPNYCNYDLRVAGKKEDIEYLYKCLNYPYKYDDENKKYPEHDHFCRIFEAELVDEEIIPSKIDAQHDSYAEVYGDCAWSVSSCMFNGDWTYYKRLHEEYGDKCKAVNMVDVSREHNLIIEIVSEEPGCDFTEHYFIKDGELLQDECVNLTWEYVDMNDNVIELNEDDLQNLEDGVDYDSNYYGAEFTHFDYNGKEVQFEL